MDRGSNMLLQIFGNNYFALNRNETGIECYENVSDNHGLQLDWEGTSVSLTLLQSLQLLSSPIPSPLLQSLVISIPYGRCFRHMQH